MDYKRAGHRASIMHPNHGKMGLHVKNFIDQAMRCGKLQSIINKRVIKEWRHGKPKKRLLGIKLPFLLSATYVLHHAPKAVKNKFKFHYAAFWRERPIIDGLFKGTEGIIKELVENVYPSRSQNFTKALVSPSAGEEYRALEEGGEDKIFSNGPSAGFVSSPTIILEESIITIKQVMRWACMYCHGIEEAIQQMEAMLEPTVVHPKFPNRKLSPIEVLGFGNNGDIGGFISYFPEFVNRKRIIRNATKKDPSILHPEFVEAWFDRELDIGGCPAIVHQRKTGDVYTEFARLYIEAFKMVVERKNVLTYGSNKPQSVKAPQP